MPEIVQGGFPFVTNNAEDFRKLYAQVAIHGGLVIMLFNAPTAVQRAMFAAVLDELDEAPGLVNEAIEPRT